MVLSDADMGSEDNLKPAEAAEAAPGAAGRRKRKPGTKKKAGAKQAPSGSTKLCRALPPRGRLIPGALIPGARHCALDTAPLP